MAEVFRGVLSGESGFERTVAIKRLLPHYESQEAYREMFVQEANALSWLHHPNIISVIDLARSYDGQLMMVMEFVDGVSLYELLESGPLSPAMIIFLALEILRGLDYAHWLPSDRPVLGIVHRDLSPDNILLSWDGAVKIADFGLAKQRTHSRTSATRPHGKFAFMSPEQLRGFPLDGRSDLYSVGVMIWEMLTQQRLFRKEGYTPARMERLFYTPPRPGIVRHVPPDVPPDLEEVVMKLLERDSSRRYPNAIAARDALLKCADAPGVAIRSDFIRLLAVRFPSRARRPPSTSCSEPPRKNRANVWPMVRAVLAVLVGCSVGLGIGLALAWLLPL